MPSDEEFNSPDADVILRALGPPECDFRVHKLILSLVSPIFRDTFSLPQPTSSTSEDSDVAEIVSVTDPPHALRTILKIIYPNTTASHNEDLDTLVECLVIAEKYEMENVTLQLCSALSQFKTPLLRIYAIAARFGFTNLAALTFDNIVQSVDLAGIPQLPVDFDFISATAYHRLVRQRAHYMETFAGIIKRAPLQFTVCSGCRGGRFTEEVFRLRLSHLIMTGTPAEVKACFGAWVKVYGRNVECEEECVAKFIHAVIFSINKLFANTESPLQRGNQS